MSDKVALVIGNQHYECDKLKGLFYSEKDAYDVAQALYTLGFKVRTKRNICAVIVEMWVKNLSILQHCTEQSYMVSLKSPCP